MIYELQKILHNRLGMGFLFLVVLLNGVLFYNHCIDNSKGYSLIQVKEKYAVADKLTEELAELDKQVNTFSSDDYFVWNQKLLTDNIYNERRLDIEVLDRIYQAKSYKEYLTDLQQQAVLWLHSGLFGSEDDFSVRSIQRSIDIYAALENVVPHAIFTGGTEAINTWKITDLFLVLFCCLPGLQLVTYERSAGYLALLRPTVYGRGHLYMRKYLAMLFITLVGYVLLYSTNVVIAKRLLGFGDLSVPVQSIYGLRECPFILSIGKYLFAFLLLKILWVLAMASFFFLLCNLSGQSALVLLYAAGAVGIFTAMNASTSLWLQTLNLLSLSDISAIFSGNFFLNFFGAPIWRIAFTVAFCIFSFFACFIGGLIIFCHTPKLLSIRINFPSLNVKRHYHTNLLRHEAQKLFFMNYGALILILFLVIQLIAYQNFYIKNDSTEYYYRQYSTILSGPPTNEKSNFLQEEEVRFAEIRQKIDAYIATFDSNTDSDYVSLATKQLTEELEKERGFEQAKAQYEGLKGSMVYIYQSGYTRLYNIQGQLDNLWNLLKLFLVLVVVLSGIFAQETETGVYCLQQTAGRAKAILVRKLIIVTAFLLLAMSITFLPQYVVILRGYGLPQITAIANSLSVFYKAPSEWTIFHLFIRTAAVRFALAAGACTLILTVSHKTKDTILTMILTGAALIFPTLSAIIFLTYNK